MLRDVRHVPDLRLNLIFGIDLDKEGFQNYFGTGRWNSPKERWFLQEEKFVVCYTRPLGRYVKIG